MHPIEKACILAGLQVIAEMRLKQYLRRRMLFRRMAAILAALLVVAVLVWGFMQFSI